MDCVPLWTGENWHMDYRIRRIAQCEYALLEDFLYEAIFLPEGFEGEILRSIVHDDPKCRAAFEGFGTLPDNRALVAEADGKILGACWVRTTNEYGHIDSNTPSFSIALYKPYRSKGIGTALMQSLLAELESAGYERASLSVRNRDQLIPIDEVGNKYTVNL